jgi:hypothetical protein
MKSHKMRHLGEIFNDMLLNKCFKSNARSFMQGFVKCCVFGKRMTKYLIRKIKLKNVLKRKSYWCIVLKRKVHIE